MSSEFQNRLRQGLDQPSPGQHPAPDVLNAYIERVLPALEERQVLAHLSACTECREIVYLASCAVEEPATLAAVAAPARKVRWWTWAAPLAAVLVVASTVFLFQAKNLRNMRSAAPQEIAQARRDAAPPAMAPPVSLKKEDSVEKQSHITPPRQIEPKLSKESQPFAKDKVVQNPSAPLSPQQSDRLQAYGHAQLDAKAAAAPAVRAEPSNGISAATGAVTAGAAVAAAPPPPAQNETVQVTSETAMVDVQTADEAKSLNLNAPAKNEAAQNAYVFRGARAKKAQSVLDWRVSADGKLEHLLLGEWKPVPSPQAQFLTVSSVGPDVWVAGKNLALYHSPDSGVNWERQSLPAASTDIVHIEFASATIGILKTSSAGAFSTHDGGKTWIASDQSH